MSTVTTETSAATRLQLMWLASPALPVGGFSYSEGLEAAVEAGLLNTEAQASDWLSDQLQLSLARAELPALAACCTAWAQHGATDASGADVDDSAAQVATEIDRINQWLLHTRDSAESRAQALQMGRSLLEWLRNSMHADDPRIQTLAALLPGPLWPTAFALATTLAGASREDALLTFAWSWAENMAQAALKAVGLGQAAAQRLLARLAADIPAAVQAALVLPAPDRQVFAPMLAVLSAQHETQYSRLFRS